MDDQVQRLVRKAWTRFQELPPSKRLLIGISGIPGSGKTTFSKLFTARLNSLSESSTPPAIFLPMDGFHFTRAHLSSMPDPDKAHARRGAAFTFDAPKFLALVQSLRIPLQAADNQVILAPTFDHAAKDPKEDDLQILPGHRIVVLEGNYINLDRDVWRDAAALLDESWFVLVDFQVARRRLRERHVRAGIVKTLEEGDRRAMENDLINGKEVVEHQVRVDEVVVSQPDDDWVGT